MIASLALPNARNQLATARLRRVSSNDSPCLANVAAPVWVPSGGAALGCYFTDAFALSALPESLMETISHLHVSLERLRELIPDRQLCILGVGRTCGLNINGGS